jgi:hypothetical protein
LTVLASNTGIAPVRSRHALVWSEYWYLFAAVIAAAVMVDPTESDILKIQPVFRHLALMVSILPLLLTLVGRKIQEPPWQRTAYTSKILGTAWPFLALAVMIIAGAFYARFHSHIQSTFLVAGLYILTAFSAAAIALQTDAPEALVRAYFRILLAAAVVMSVSLLINFRVRQVYHEEIFLVIPLAALYFAQARRKVMRWVGCLFFLSMAYFSPKLTSYLIGAVTVAYLTLAFGYPRLESRPRLNRVTTIYWACVLAMLMTIAMLGYLALRGGDASDLPSGNLDYRLHTYGAAWERFTKSPVWGTLFVAEAVEKFSLYDIGIARNVLPTHSDIMDLLAHGGSIALLLWALGLIRIGWVCFKNLLRPKFLSDPLAPYAHTLALMSIAGVITYAFNPILLQPSMAYLLWTNLGLLLGLSLRAPGKELPSKAAR